MARLRDRREPETEDKTASHLEIQQWRRMIATENSLESMPSAPRPLREEFRPAGRDCECGELCSCVVE